MEGWIQRHPFTPNTLPWQYQYSFQQGFFFHWDMMCFQRVPLIVLSSVYLPGWLTSASFGTAWRQLFWEWHSRNTCEQEACVRSHKTFFSGNLCIKYDTNNVAESHRLWSGTHCNQGTCNTGSWPSNFNFVPRVSARYLRKIFFPPHQDGQIKLPPWIYSETSAIFCF